MGKLEIVVSYTSIDRCYKRRSFATLAGAQKFAHSMVGPHPTIGEVFQYAVSDDGVGKVTVRGVSLDTLFPAPVSADIDRSQEYAWDYDDRDL